MILTAREILILHAVHKKVFTKKVAHILHNKTYINMYFAREMKKLAREIVGLRLHNRKAYKY